MKTLLSRSTVSPAKLIGATLITATLSMPAMAKGADLESLIEAAQKRVRFTVWACQTVGQLERHMD